MAITMKEIIKRKLKCSDEEAEETVRELKDIAPQFAELLAAWSNDQPYSDIEVCGYTIQSLVNDYDLGFIGALLTLDWIWKEPDEACKALQFGIR